MYSGTITNIFYNKGDFYIFAVVLENHEQLTLKGNLSDDLKDKIKAGNTIEFTGEKTWNDKYKKYEVIITADNIENITTSADSREDLEVLEGEITNIIYKEQGFNVFEVETKGTTHKCISNTPVFIGTQMKLAGYFQNEGYGRTFKVVEKEELPFSNQQALKSFLSSDFFTGIGDHFAAKIVDEFGLDTMDVLRNNPAKLTQISGIGQKRSQTIIESFKDKIQLKEIIKFAVEHDITEKMIFKLFEKYGRNLINLLQQNPYLITELHGIGFKKADEIAEEVGIEADSNYRINSFLTYYLSSQAGGHTYFDLAEIAKEVKQELELAKPISQMLAAYYNFEEIEYQIEREGEVVTETFTKDFILFIKDKLTPLIKCKDEAKLRNLIKQNKVCIATKKNYDQERKIYQKLKDINSIPPKRPLKELEINQLITKQEEEQGFKYTEQQKKILKRCLNYKLTVLTGKAGTGKSTVANGIINMFTSNDLEVLNLAPTGKAAKRITEVTDKEAHTIHSAVYNLAIEEYDVIMVDEAGMLSTAVAFMLINKLNFDQSLVLIGDVAQIPPVQPGNIFRDLINMIQSSFLEGLFVELDEIKRQDKDSHIEEISRKIVQGQEPGRIDYDDIQFEHKENQEIIDYIIGKIEAELTREEINLKDIQVISPQYKTIVGINAINEAIQEQFNPHDFLIETEYYQVKQEDKVMQTKNMPSLELVNGDTLEVKRIKEQEEVDDLGNKQKEKFVVCKLNNNLENRWIEYPIADFLRYTTLAYCCSAHKMQGSEYPVVIYVVSTSHYIMLNRNLLYTGITRGKKRVYIVGQPKAFYIALDKEVNQTRNTILDLINYYQI